MSLKDLCNFIVTVLVTLAIIIGVALFIMDGLTHGGLF